MTPDHDPEFVVLLCPAKARLETKRSARVSIKERLVTFPSVRTTCAPKSEL
jgi:hypothetical protein